MLNNIFSNKYLQLIFRLFIGGMFVTVAISKILTPEKFANEIGNYNLLPDFSINLIALFLPWLELTTGIMLIFGLKIRENSTLIFSMLLVFTLGVLSAMARGLDINCGCYSEIAQKKVGWGKILENTGLIILTIYIFISTYFQKDTFILSNDVGDSNIDSNVNSVNNEEIITE